MSKLARTAGIIVALLVWLGMAILSSWDTPADGATVCTDQTGADTIHEGDRRTPLEGRLGHGERVMRDRLTSGVSYATCTPGDSLVVLYFRDTRTVAHVFYTP